MLEEEALAAKERPKVGGRRTYSWRRSSLLRTTSPSFASDLFFRAANRRVVARSHEGGGANTAGGIKLQTPSRGSPLKQVVVDDLGT